jgi:hypothetical protein
MDESDWLAKQGQGWMYGLKSLEMLAALVSDDVCFVLWSILFISPRSLSSYILSRGSFRAYNMLHEPEAEDCANQNKAG